jgi:hypothetical protein
VAALLFFCGIDLLFLIVILLLHFRFAFRNYGSIIFMFPSVWPRRKLAMTAPKEATISSAD